MTTLRVYLKRMHKALGESIAWPTRMSTHAAGFDLAAAIDAPVQLEPGQRRLLPTGFAMAFSPGFEAQIRARSGLALKHGVTVLNSPGTIDSDYRGEIKVLLINHGQEPFVINPGDRIAQMVFAQVMTPGFEVVTHLDEGQDAGARGTGGYGSTGI